MVWPAFVLTRPLGAAGGDSLTKPIAQGGLGRGTLWGSAAPLGVLAVLVAHQTRQVRRHPMDSLPAPHHRRTVLPRRPNARPAPAPSDADPSMART
ncbi:hypothetical protein ACFXOD_07135 [Streptomyces sp. NPDC059161]|uniref:hypothetical protein n=1 Tax=Streptomyces sp. NPDC059161 TaxID=3346749 RepID=UPI00369542BA